MQGRSWRRRAFGAALFVFAAALAAPASADFAAGLAAYEAGDFAAAFRYWRPLAEKGETAAMRNLGHLYRWGRGVEKKPGEAARWYRRAADLGLDRAQANLASLYLHGEGVEQDHGEAAYWFQRAALQGHVVAQYNLGLLYEHGLGVAKNIERAIGFYGLAAKAGHPQSQDRLQEITVAMSEPAAPAVKPAELNLAESEPTIAETVATVAIVQVPPSAETAPIVAAAPPPPARMAKLVPPPRWDPLPPRSIDPPARKMLAALTRPVQKAAAAPTKSAFDVAALIAPPAPPPAASAPAPAESNDDVFGLLFKVVRAVFATSDDIETGASTPARQRDGARPANSAAVAAAAAAQAREPALVAERIGRGLAAHRTNDYQTALSLWLPLAFAGQVKAQVLVGKLYHAGQGVPVDKVRATMWWILAARQGDADAKAALLDLGPKLSPDQIAKARSQADDFRVQG